MTDDLGSWEERIDWALGNAGAVLEHASDQLKAGRMDLGTAEAASSLAESWRDLASAWQERSSLLVDPAEEDYTDEDDDPVLSRLRQRAP